MKGSKATCKLYNNWDHLPLDQEWVAYHTVQDAGKEVRKLIVPRALQEKILEALYDAMGH